MDDATSDLQAPEAAEMATELPPTDIDERRYEQSQSVEVDQAETAPEPIPEPIPEPQTDVAPGAGAGHEVAPEVVVSMGDDESQARMASARALFDGAARRQGYAERLTPIASPTMPATPAPVTSTSTSTSRSEMSTAAAPEASPVASSPAGQAAGPSVAGRENRPGRTESRTEKWIRAGELVAAHLDSPEPISTPTDH